MENKSRFTIGQLSKSSGISIETIRYYESIKVISPISRNHSGYRIFNEDSIRTLNFLKHAQELGFSLSQIKELLKLKADKKSHCKEVKNTAEVHLKNTKEKIKKLKEIEKVLLKLVRQCDEKQISNSCPILECFEAD